MTFARLSFVASALLCLACRDGEPSSGRDPDDAVSEHAAAHEKSASNDPLVRALDQRAGEIGPHMVRVGDDLRGQLATGGTQDFQVVLFAEHCYKIVGAGTSDVLDLDVLLFDPADVQVAQDSAIDEAPVIGVRSPICPPLSGAYRLQVRMFRGDGSFAVRVLGSK